MSDSTTQDQTAVQSQLAALLAQMQAPGVTSSASPWAQSKSQSIPTEVLGVSIPISFDTPDGKLRVYLNFPGSAAASPKTLKALVESLVDAELPLDFWQQHSGGGESWKGNRGGHNNNRGNRGR